MGADTTSPEWIYGTYKTLLFSIAYRMLGSVTDAEDMVQDTFLSWNEKRPAQIKDVKSYLCKMVTNRCLDRLRSASRKRESYVGQWIPEPLLDTIDMNEPSNQMTHKESLSTAYLLLLQQLSGVERAVFVLREVLMFDYDQIAEVVNKTPTNCRQIFHRAKRAVQMMPAQLDQEQQPFSTNIENESPLIAPVSSTSNTVEQFIHALTAGNVTTSVSLLASDAVLMSDGGGKVRAALQPILGADRISRFLAGLLTKMPTDLISTTANVNGELGMVLYMNKQPLGVVSFAAASDRIRGIYIVINPDKLTHVHPLC
ncbi:RNA polymerase sigma-70 factor [Paenibacillus taiwanensis]|uniref:RNA polymerase sigma-70 factor n=1 Tax=Paenibacillus taiwanensis TaxID=401638 RepID=UPI00040D737A|nr:RNA polymerase sigma-70 factor [Paenibacillus taiwanensis]